MKQKVSSISYIVLLFLFTGCIQTPVPDTPKRISFLLNIKNVGDTLSVSSDTLRVSEVKFFADKINLSTPGGETLQTAVDGLVMAYLNSFGGRDQTVLSATIGFEGFNQFKGMKLFIAPPEDGDNITDTDFFGSKTNYSFIIEGTFNEKKFFYTSELAISKNLPFANTVTLTNVDETLIVRFKSDVKKFLMNESQSRLLNPADPQDAARIDSLFKATITVESLAKNNF